MASGKKVTIVTHNGSFHADDIFAVATLLLVLEKDNEVTVLRSRDMEVINSAEYVVDVGGVYDESINRFDHHQHGGAGVRKNTIPYASFGLVWKKYGEALCGDKNIVEKIDQVLVQPIDAGDNAFQLVETNVKGIYPYDIGLFFNTFTPGIKKGLADIDKIFMEPVSLARTILLKEISKRQDLVEIGLIVTKIYEESKNKKIIVLDKYYPVREFLSKFSEPLFVVFPREDGLWAIKTIRDNANTFVDRKSLPKSWGGYRDSELEKITGVSGAVICHRDAYLAVAKTKEGVLKMAEIALNS